MSMAGDGDGRAGLPRIAVLGAGIFARTQYIPRLREIAHLVVLKAIWSRTQVCAPVPAPLRILALKTIECAPSHGSITVSACRAANCCDCSNLLSLIRRCL